jgi:hypothetical protein
MAAATKTELQNNANRSIGQSDCTKFTGEGNSAAAGIVACRCTNTVTVGTRNSLIIQTLAARRLEDFFFQLWFCVSFLVSGRK